MPKWKKSISRDDKISRPLNRFSGLPQGSINDLPSQVKYSSIDLYADDAQLRPSCKLGMIEDGADKVNADLRSILKWSNANNLHLNPGKSKCLVIYKNIFDYSYFPSLHLGGQQLEYVEKAKKPGVFFNRTLTWEDHIQTVIG